MSILKVILHFCICFVKTVFWQIIKTELTWCRVLFCQDLQAWACQPYTQQRGERPSKWFPDSVRDKLNGSTHKTTINQFTRMAV